MLLATHVSLQAQEFEFQYKGTVYKDGTKLTINAENNMFGELACETNPSSNPNDGLLIVGKDGAHLSGKAHLTILKHTFKANIVQWCMGGSCVLMKTITELDKTFEGNAVQVSFDAITICQEGYLVAKLDVTVGNKSQSLYIEFSNGETSNYPDNSDNSDKMRGDVNGDGVVNAADVVEIVNIITSAR